MFSFFDEPIFRYRYTPVRVVRDPFDYMFSPRSYYNPMYHYLKNIEKHYNELLEMELSNDQPKEEIKKEDKPVSQDTPVNKEIKEEEKKPKEIPQKSYFYSSTKHFNGNDYVEESRETIRGSNGEEYHNLTRRLGDRWYKNEEHIDQEGKKSTKETWHQVPEDEIESFKAEWSRLHEKPKSQLEHKNSEQEEKKPESITNETKETKEEKEEQKETKNE